MGAFTRDSGFTLLADASGGGPNSLLVWLIGSCLMMVYVCDARGSQVHRG